MGDRRSRGSTLGAIDPVVFPDRGAITHPACPQGATNISVESPGASTVVAADCGGAVVKALVKGQPSFSLGERIRMMPPETSLAFFRSASGEQLVVAATHPS